MIRKELKAIGSDDRHTFTAEFVRFGKKSAYKGPDLTTLLFKDVRNVNGKVVTDHLWFTMTKGFEKCELQEGDIIQFDARVAMYEKGYKGRRYGEEYFLYMETSIDYKLSYPTKIKVVKRATI